MKFKTWILVAVLLAAVAVAAAQTQRAIPSDLSNHPLSAAEKGGMDETGPYEVVPDHFKPPFPAGWTWGPVAGIHADSPDRIYVYSRGMLPVLKQNVTGDGLPARNATEANNANSELGPSLRREHVLTVYDRNGNPVADWKHLDAMHPEGSSVHALKVDPRDPDKHLWLLDTRLNQILKVTTDGKVVMRIGPDTVPGRFVAQFGEEASTTALAWAATARAAELAGKRVQADSILQNMAFLPNGDFFAVESSRVVKFSKDGQQLMAFGKRGTAPGEINAAHSIAIDAQGRIYVGERSRIQVFDQSGRSLDIWPNIRFGAGFIAIDRNNHLWVADGEIHRIAGFDLDGRLLSVWGVTGLNPGQLYGVSAFDVDSEGNLYMAEHYGGRVQMFRPKKNADRKRLIAPLLQ